MSWKKVRKKYLLPDQIKFAKHAHVRFLQSSVGVDYCFTCDDRHQSRNRLWRQCKLRRKIFAVIEELEALHLPLAESFAKRKLANEMDLKQLAVGEIRPIAYLLEEHQQSLEFWGAAKESTVLMKVRKRYAKVRKQGAHLGINRLF